MWFIFTFISDMYRRIARKVAACASASESAQAPFCNPHVKPLIAKPVSVGFS